ncbi:MAG: sulfotransferase, partial [Gammaproteobacteria bacterium]
MSRIAEQYRPLALRAANFLGRTLATRPLTADSLMRAAAHRARSDDFGTGFETGLARLLDALNREACLNLVGWLSARTYLVRLLTNRARLEADRRRHPEIEAARVDAPLVITGLPRTGSTLLFELLAQDPRLRAPIAWEVMLPSPPPRTATFHQDRRIRRTQRLLNYVDRIAPRFKAIHPVGAILPQECIAITAHAFQSILFHTTHNVASYQGWLNEQPLHGAYEYHRRFLQQLQAFGPKGRWLLKAPGHLFGLDALFAVYPDASVIVTCRDPAAVVGSVASHCASLRQAFSEQLNLHAIGRSWTDLWALGWRRQASFRRRRPELDGRLLDVAYDELIADPMAQVAYIYRHFEIELGD